MGKRIIQQARGHGSGTYRVRRSAFRYKLKYPANILGKARVIKLLNSAGHSAPIAKISFLEKRDNQIRNEIFYIPAFRGMFEGQEIIFGGKEIKNGNILNLEDIPIKTKIYCIESKPGDGGIFIKSGGSCGIIARIIDNKIYVLMPSKKEKEFHKNCRAIIGTVAGSGRLDKPLLKAGKSYHIKKSKGKLWPRTSAVKMNVIDHPFGSGRGKNPKSKIAKRNAPPGKKVGLIRPRRTGKRK